MKLRLTIAGIAYAILWGLGLWAIALWFDTSGLEKPFGYLIGAAYGFLGAALALALLEAARGKS